MTIRELWQRTKWAIKFACQILEEFYRSELPLKLKPKLLILCSGNIANFEASKKPRSTLLWPRRPKRCFDNYQQRTFASRKSSIEVWKLPVFLYWCFLLMIGGLQKGKKNELKHFFFFQRPKDLQNRCNFQTVLQLVTNLQGSSARLFCNPCAACLAIPDCFLKNFSLTLRLWWVIAAMKVSNLQYFQYNTMRLETCLFTYLKEFSAPNNDADPLIFYQMSL